MSGINVNIVAGENGAASSVSVTGSLVHIITDEERRSFGIGSDAQLKSAVGKNFGKEPLDAFLHRPTPWDDLYDRFGGEEVKTFLIPKSATVLGVTSKPTILATATMQNDTNRDQTFTSSINETVTDTLSTNWNASATLSFNQSITYGVEFLGTGATGSTTIGFQATYGIGGTEEKQMSVGSEASVTVTLGAHESAEVELTASKGSMQVRIVYEAFIKGCCWVNYNPTYKDHHFWGLGIQNILSSAGLTNSVQVEETIEVGYFSNVKMIVRNASTKELIPFHIARCG